MTTWILTILLTVAISVSIWLYNDNTKCAKLPTLRKKRICLLIAHPDDEAMFFSPTLLALTQPSLGNHVKILCLSSGDSEGLGATRKKEIAKSGIALGLRTEDDVFVIESAEFPDSIKIHWNQKSVVKLLFSAFASHLETSDGTSNPVSTATIDVLITFDSGGISGHPNHISLFHGARKFITLLSQFELQNPVHLYTLTSVSFLRKYTAFLDAIVSIIMMKFSGQNFGKTTSKLLFLNKPTNIIRAQRAMSSCHKSQMKWYRWGWIIWSRYMIVNDLRLELHTDNCNEGSQ